MATHKRIDGDYVVTTINPEDYFFITTHTVEITGNLNVIGNITYIETTELKVDDPFITVAANNSGNLGTALFPNQGLVAQTSSNTFAGLRFDNTANTWQISPSVDAAGAPIDAYANLSTGNVAAGGANTNIQFNDSGSFGGNADFSFDKTVSRVTLQGHQIFGNIGTAPGVTANAVAVYHNAQGMGGTGLFVRSPSVEDELVSKTKAIVFGIIF